MFYRLDAFALAVSQHYRMLKEVVMDSHVPRLMSSEDARAADEIADIIENIGGRGLANYCRMKFQRAWLSWDVKEYDVKGMFEYVAENCVAGQFKDQLRLRLDSLVDLVSRLSNPLHRKYRTNTAKKHAGGPAKVEQMFLFPELAPPPEKKAENTADGDKPKQEHEPKQEREPRQKRKSRLDKLADEIIGAEYGTPEQQDDEEAEDAEDYRADDDRRGDACERYSQGYFRMSDRDYGYFSGNCDD